MLPKVTCDVHLPLFPDSSALEGAGASGHGRKESVHGTRLQMFYGRQRNYCYAQWQMLNFSKFYFCGTVVSFGRLLANSCRDP